MKKKSTFRNTATTSFEHIREPNVFSPDEPAPESDRTTDKTITPIISSRIAAEIIIVPALPFNRCISFNVATVTDTEVAVKITP